MEGWRPTLISLQCFLSDPSAGSEIYSSALVHVACPSLSVLLCVLPLLRCIGTCTGLLCNFTVVMILVHLPNANESDASATKV